MNPLVSIAFRLPQEILTKGDIGVEIEIEGKNLGEAGPEWKRTKDGSLLPSPEAIEYVFRQPLSHPKSLAAIDHLYDVLESNRGVINDSVRAGIHVHVNVQNLTVVELYNFITLYLILEELLVKYCGPTREGNLFCLRASDANYLITRLCRAIKMKKLREVFNDEDLRYSSINVMSVCKYGSLEFRSMRTTKDRAIVKIWVSLLYHLRECAIGYNDPTDIVRDFSLLGPAQFVAKNVPKLLVESILQGDWASHLTSGVRNAQDVAYSVDWDSIKSQQSVNPFIKAKIDVAF